jgi:hypothetical protein
MAPTFGQLLELAFLLHEVSICCDSAPRAAILSRQI